jgi:hypothetical protein
MGLKLGQKRLFHYALLLFAHGQSFRRLLHDSPGPLTSHHLTRSTRCQSIGYWVSDKQPLTDINNWRKVTPAISRSAVANLTYRITALYSGRDSVLGASAGLKHFGMRRLGRTGLSNRPPLAEASSPTDNVWDVDCSSFFPQEVGGAGIHGAYFQNEGTINLVRHVLRGLDRGVLNALGYTKGTGWPGTR